MSTDIIVKKSKIEGKGVFAARDFKKGEVVLKWDLSHELTKEQAEKLPKNEKQYVSYFKGRYTLMQPPSKYVNHSCSPNTKVRDFCDIANRDIKRGEEITSDYESESVSKSKMKCECGSKNCRKIIDV